MVNVKSFWIALFMTIISATGTIVVLKIFGPDWLQYAPANCTTTRCFCEMPRTGSLILQPANSWSSFGFVFAGFLMIILARGHGWKSALTPTSATVFGFTLVMVGLGSALLHSTLTLSGQFFDVLGMYMVSGFMLVYAFSKWLRMSNRNAVILYAIVLVTLVAALVIAPEIRREVFGILVLLTIVVELGFARPHRKKIKLKYFLFGIISNAIAYIIWNLDQNGQICAPENLIQGHAIWHFGGALALWFTFLYYHSEQSTNFENSPVP